MSEYKGEKLIHAHGDFLRAIVCIGSSQMRQARTDERPVDSIMDDGGSA